MDVIPGVINTLVSLCVAINDKIEAARDCEGDFTALKAYVCGLKAALAPIKKLLHELDVAEALGKGLNMNLPYILAMDCTIMYCSTRGLAGG